MRATFHGVLLAALVLPATAFYLPGVAPQQYENFESVAMKVNKLTSIKTQLPYEYYALPFCQPTAARCIMELVDGHHPVAGGRGLCCGAGIAMRGHRCLV